MENKLEARESQVFDNAIMNIHKRISVMNIDISRLKRAKRLLNNVQIRKTFVDLLGYDDDTSLDDNADLNLLQSKLSFKSIHRSDSDSGSGEELGEELCQVAFEEDRWHNYFRNFDMLTEPEGEHIDESQNCVELTMFQSHEEIKIYLQSGVRCFLLDLFPGSLQNHQSIVVKLHEAELSVSKEYGFPITSTLIAKLSPRYQYTGYLNTGMAQCCCIELKEGWKIKLTVDRAYANNSNSRNIYVNARFLLCDIREFDYIPIGEDIQLMVRKVYADYIDCCVGRGGLLKSYMPVIFPRRCHKFSVSYEELEDLTFAHEIGINIVVSNIYGTAKYVDDLERVMKILECDQLRLYARVVINEIKGCNGDMNWVTQRYDGFLVELAAPPNSTDDNPDIMHLCPDAECFMKLAYETKKPIVLDPQLISDRKLIIDPSYYYYIFYYPDKYLVKSKISNNAFYFTFLQGAISNQIHPITLSKMPMCDSSHTGVDSMARAVVASSTEANAVAIIVCGVTARMVEKVAHYRPVVPIIFVSHMKSAADYVSVYYNVTMLPFTTKKLIPHRQNTFRKTIYALSFLSSRQVLKQGDRIILVYNFSAGTTYPEKYIIYKFDKNHFISHMAKSLFPVEEETYDWLE